MTHYDARYLYLRMSDHTHTPRIIALYRLALHYHLLGIFFGEYVS